MSGQEPPAAPANAAASSESFLQRWTPSILKVRRRREDGAEQRHEANTASLRGVLADDERRRVTTTTLPA